jgi:hypothetical protein
MATNSPGEMSRSMPCNTQCAPNIGEDTGTPVSEDYQVPFKFTGDLKKVAIQLTDAALSAEDQAEIEKMRAEIGVSE